MHVISLHGADIHMTGLAALRSAAYWTMEVLEDVDRVLRKGLFSLHMYLVEARFVTSASAIDSMKPDPKRTVRLLQERHQPFPSQKPLHGCNCLSFGWMETDLLGARTFTLPV